MELIAIGTNVKLRSFLETRFAPKKTDPRNNYWKLIGEKGQVIDGINDNGRVLALFEKDLDEFEVENHNPILNSLWIKPADLDLF